MKRILFGLLVVLLAGALVISCDSNVSTASSETVTVSFATTMGRALTSSVSYMDFEDLDWFYQAIPAENAEFTHGATEDWTELEDLSDEITLSQGIWTFKLQAKYEDEAVYEGEKSGVLIKKQSTPISVTINVSPVEDGNGSIILSDITIEGIEDGESHYANKAVIDDEIELELDFEESGDVVQPISAGDHTVVITYEVDGIVYGSETIEITVYSGSTVTIKGYISEDSQSAVFVPYLQVPETTFSKQLPVDSESISDDNSTATVSGDTTITNGDLVVTYPEGTKIVEASADSTTNTADAKTGVRYVSDSLSSVSVGKDITLQDNEGTIAQYELTLNVDEENETLLTVQMYIEEGLAITRVLHNGEVLATSAAEEGEDPREYYTYDKTNGLLTIYVFHASPIEVITAKTSHLPAGAILVSNLEELEDAVENLRDGYYIAFVANIVQDKVDTTSGQITFKRASDAEGDIEATLDLNGFVFEGQIGGFSFANNGITVNVIGTEEAKAEYFEHETGHHMVYACNIFNYTGKTVIKDGLFKSNNINVMAYGGDIVFDGGKFINEEESGVNLYACNDPKVVINGGDYSSKGAVIYVETYRDDYGPEVVINGGNFDSSEGCCMFVVEEGTKPYAKITVNGGNFEFNNDEDGFIQVVGDIDPTDYLFIQGGTFNRDPSAYVDTENYSVTENDGTWTVSAK